MKSEAFDALTRSLTGVTPRRGLLRALIAGGAVGIGASIPQGADGKNKNRKHKHKKDKKPKNNAFGCLDVGKTCGGKDEQCCSGICEGKKPKKGKKDKSRCAAHNSSICQSGIDACLGIELECGNKGFCFQTTGKAPFCAGGTGVCADCQKDTDCEEQGFGPGSACVVCGIACPGTVGTVCFPTGA